MEGPEIIEKYFPALSEAQKAAFAAMGPAYTDWNARINVISRKDIDAVYSHHILHSLALAKVLGPLPAGATVLDLGTGGGFPGIPLAVIYPEVSFHLVDRIGKKLTVAAAVAETCGIRNVTFQHGDASEVRRKYDYVVSRAVMSLDALYAAARHAMAGGSVKGSLPRGLLALKGGDLTIEAAALKRPVEIIPISDFFFDEYFATKSVVYVKS